MKPGLVEIELALRNGPDQGDPAARARRLDQRFDIRRTGRQAEPAADALIEHVLGGNVLPAKADSRSSGRSRCNPVRHEEEAPHVRCFRDARAEFGRRRRTRSSRSAFVLQSRRFDRRRPQEAAGSDRQHVDRRDAVQFQPARSGRPRAGRHSRGRRHAARVQHDRDQRRHHDGHRGHEDIARQPRGDRRLDRAGRARLRLRCGRRAGRLRQDDSRPRRWRCCA